MTSGPVCKLYMKCHSKWSTYWHLKKVELYIGACRQAHMYTCAPTKHRSKICYTHPCTCMDAGLRGQCSVCFQAPLSLYKAWTKSLQREILFFMFRVNPIGTSACSLGPEPVDEHGWVYWAIPWTTLSKLHEVDFTLHRWKGGATMGISFEKN